MGRKLVLTGTTLTDPDAPRLTNDPILPNEGALLLLDPTHPAEEWASGVPAHNDLFPNIAYQQAKELVPAGTEETLGARFVIGPDFSSGDGSVLLERTGNGGLHTIFSRVNLGTANQYIYVLGGADIDAYVAANKAHSWYTAVWGLITRPVLTIPSGGWPHSRVDQTGKIALFYTRPGSGTLYLPNDSTRIGGVNEGANTTTPNTPFFQDIGVTTGAAATTLTNRAWMQNRSFAGVGNYEAAPSMIFYGFYVEDLTVSGRTYAEVNALVQAKYTADVKTSGGRYYGDTYTAPATLP